MVLRKKSILLIMVFLIGGFVCACGKEDSVAGESLVEDTEEVSSTEETKNTEEEAAVQWEKGYDLPVDEQEREEAETLELLCRRLSTSKKIKMEQSH